MTARALPSSSLPGQGPTNDGRRKPDLCATDRTSCYTYGSGRAIGTSFSSPVVAGAAALVLQRYPAITIVAMADTLRSWAKNVPSGGWDSVFGGGLLNLKFPTPAPMLVSPSNNSANMPAGGGFALTWSSMVGAPACRVQVSSASAFGTTVFDNASLTGVTTALAVSLSGNTLYYWRMRPVYNTCFSGPWSAAWSFTTALTAPSAPLLSAPANASSGVAVSTTLSWSSSKNAAAYAVQASTSSSFATTVSNQGGLTATAAVLSGLANATVYYWRVNARNGAGTSAWSGVWSFTTVVRQVIPLAAGWNTKSFNIHPADSSLATVFNGRRGFVLVKNDAGQQFMPSVGIDEIGTFRTGKGYQIYSDVTDTIRGQGSVVVVASTPIGLTANSWSIIGYLPQSNMAIATALAGISSKLILVKNDAGQQYWPGLGVDDIGTMRVGEGYYIVTNATTSLTYPASGKSAAMGSELLHLPPPRHFGGHGNTGNNASILGTSVSIGNRTAPDNSEIGAFDASGNLVGAGSVQKEVTAFVIWGDDPQTGAKNGCGQSEAVTLRLWDGTQEYPAVLVGAPLRYAVNGINMGRIMVPEGSLIREFSLTRVYPNPSRGMVRIAFEVPGIQGAPDQTVSIEVYDMKGSLVQRIAKGRYAPGRYTAVWNGETGAQGRMGVSGGALYIVRMKADNFDKRVRLVLLR